MEAGDEALWKSVMTSSDLCYGERNISYSNGTLLDLDLRIETSLRRWDHEKSQLRTGLMQSSQSFDRSRLSSCWSATETAAISLNSARSRGY